MNYDQFVSHARHQALFSSDFLETLGYSKAYGRLTLSRWEKTGKVIRLKRNLYTLPDNRRDVFFSNEWLSGALYSPSYLSCEYMLSWYDLIPEQTNLFTCVSTLKTANFKTSFGQFDYHHLKKEAFTGFNETKDEFGRPVLKACKEKALLDTVYFSKSFEASKDYFEINLRLQQTEQLKLNKLKFFSKKFNIKKIDLAVEILESLI